MTTPYSTDQLATQFKIAAYDLTDEREHSFAALTMKVAEHFRTAADDAGLYADYSAIELAHDAEDATLLYAGQEAWRDHYGHARHWFIKEAVAEEIMMTLCQWANEYES